MVRIRSNENKIEITNTSNVTLDQLEYIIKNAKTLDKLGQLEEAISMYDKVLEFIPNDVDALYRKANSLSKIGKYEQALACYEKIIENDPTHIEALYHQKITLNKLGMHYGIAPTRRRQLL